MLRIWYKKSFSITIVVECTQNDILFSQNDIPVAKCLNEDGEAKY